VAPAQPPLSRAQAGAAIAVYQQALAGCAGGPAAACEAEARRRFVALMACVTRGEPPADAAAADRAFAAFAEQAASALDRPESGPPGEPGPCFAGAAGPAAPAGGEEGPTLEALRRAREQATEPAATPVVPAPVEEPSSLDGLRRDPAGPGRGPRRITPGPHLPQAPGPPGAAAPPR
jgi:hypothetical protein